MDLTVWMQVKPYRRAQRKAQAASLPQRVPAPPPTPQRAPPVTVAEVQACLDELVREGEISEVSPGRYARNPQHTPRVGSMWEGAAGTFIVDSRPTWSTELQLWFVHGTLLKGNKVRKSACHCTDFATMQQLPSLNDPKPESR